MPYNPVCGNPLVYLQKMQLSSTEQCREQLPAALLFVIYDADGVLSDVY